MVVPSFAGILLIAGASISPGDTLMEVREGDRLVVAGFRGTVIVDSWDRPHLRARADTKEARSFRVRRSGDDLHLQLEEGTHRGRREELWLTVPSWMNLRMVGQEMEVEISGVDGDVEIRNLKGDLLLSRLGGAVEARSVEGSIEARALSGSARLRTGDDEIRILSSTASLDLTTVDGDIQLDDVRASRISARSTDGEIHFSGPVQPAGTYGFFSHGGGVTLHIPPPADFDASILSYSGRFESEFPVQAARFRSGESMEFTVGSGGARLVVETFSGPVRLVRVQGPE
jgi:hypothetical protein